MSSFQVVDSSPGSSVSIMETSNFAHVIFQNVGKSFLPQAPLECRYTLTPYITPNPKDWVGIFKVSHTYCSRCYSDHASNMPDQLYHMNYLQIICDLYHYQPLHTVHVCFMDYMFGFYQLAIG